jgi:putative spermidine/putrescine transport system substrate-binding protein
MRVTRHGPLYGAALTALALTMSCGAPNSGGSTSASGDVPDKPANAVTLNILDVAGNLQLTQGMIDQFVKDNPGVVSKVTYQKSTAPEMPGKIKAQQSAGRVDIDLVLTGVDGLSAGIDQGLWTALLPKYADRLPGMKDYLEPAAAMQKLAGGFGVEITYYPSGPLIEYLPAKVASPPTSAQALLDYAKAHPGKVQYARPANSGPGRTFLMGLPYILGDSDPKDPVNGWSKTWAYLKELNKYVSYYPSGTTETMKNLANGSVDIIASTTGWYINPRVLGTVPAEAKSGTLEGFHWVTDAHYAVVPNGVSTDKQAAVLQLLKSMLTPEQQAKAYDDGYFYPGPAIKGVTVEMAPDKSKTALQMYGNPDFDKLIENNPKETPLDAKALVTAFSTWDRDIGSGKEQK